MPPIGDNWNNFFSGELAWDGTGTIPDDTRVEMERLVANVHGEGKILRFWNLPQDAPSVWGPLYDARVDLIDTDNLVGLSTFLQTQQAAPEPPATTVLFAVLGFGTALSLKKRF